MFTHLWLIYSNLKKNHYLVLGKLSAASSLLISGHSFDKHLYSRNIMCCSNLTQVGLTDGSN